MMDIILSTPEVYFYLVIVAMPFVAALWTGPTDAAQSPGADARPFSDLHAALSASYADKFEKGVTTIRIGLPTGARPTDRAAG